VSKGEVRGRLVQGLEEDKNLSKLQGRDMHRAPEQLQAEGCNYDSVRRYVRVGEQQSALGIAGVC
jgi:hypothetical protein